MTASHVGPARCVAATFFIGVAGGCAWQWLNRRDLVDRFAVPALLVLGIGALALLPPDGTVGLDARSVPTASGIVAGNVLLEWWLRRPAQRERFGWPPDPR